jgi:hypothetical protein
MSESARINHKLYAMQRQQARIALERASQVYGTQCLSGLCTPPVTLYQQKTPLESDYLAQKVANNCSNFVGSSCALSSALTQSKIQAVLDASMNPSDPLTRFSAYNRPLPPPVCPPTPPEILNAFLPKASTTNCPLPNRPTQSSPF